MADHGMVEYATAKGNDLPAHEDTYDRFIFLATIGTIHVLNIVLGLAIGGVNHNWFVAFWVFVITTVVAAHGLASGSKTSSYVMFALSFLAFAFTAGGGAAGH